MMNKPTAKRVAKSIMDDPTERLIEAIIDLHDNRNQELEVIEEFADKAKSEDHFYLQIIQEVLLDGTTQEQLKEINENLKKQENNDFQ